MPELKEIVRQTAAVKKSLTTNFNCSKILRHQNFCSAGKKCPMNGNNRGEY